MFQPLWSADILDELGRNLLRHGVLKSGVDHRIEQMTEHFLDAMVTGYESLVAVTENQAKDRHLLAAAVRGRAELIVTAQIELRRTYIALYSVGWRPDPALALTAAETARDESQLLHVAEALALAQEYRRCEQALGRAETSFSQQYGDDPAIESYAPTQLGRMAGSCYLFLGAPERAEPLLTRTADELTDRPKTRSLVLGNVALSHLRQRQIDAACGRLHEAIDLIEESRGGGGLSAVFATIRELYPWRKEQLVQDVTERLLSLMARG